MNDCHRNCRNSVNSGAPFTFVPGGRLRRVGFGLHPGGRGASMGWLSAPGEVDEGPEVVGFEGVEQIGEVPVAAGCATVDGG